MPNQDQEQSQIDDAELEHIRRQVRVAFAEASSSSPTRLFDVILSLQPLPQLLDDLATLRAEVKTLRARLGE